MLHGALWDVMGVVALYNSPTKYVRGTAIKYGEYDNNKR